MCKCASDWIVSIHFFKINETIACHTAYQHLLLRATHTHFVAHTQTQNGETAFNSASIYSFIEFDASGKSQMISKWYCIYAIVHLTWRQRRLLRRTHKLKYTMTKSSILLLLENFILSLGPGLNGSHLMGTHHTHTQTQTENNL